MMSHLWYIYLWQDLKICMPPKNKFKVILNHMIFESYICTELILNLLTLYHIEAPFDAFANRADPDQAAIRAA